MSRTRTTTGESWFWWRTSTRVSFGCGAHSIHGRSSRTRGARALIQALAVGFLRGALARDAGALLVTCTTDAVRLRTQEGREALETLESLEFASSASQGRGVTVMA